MTLQIHLNASQRTFGISKMGFFWQTLILGCTELPLAVPPAECPDCVDPARALARALIRETSPDKLKPLAGIVRM